MDSGIGKASQEMIKELQKMQQQDQVKDPGGKAGGESGAKFNQSLQNHSQVNEAQNLQKLQEASKTTQTTQAKAPTAIDKALQTQNSHVQDAKKPGMFGSVVKEMMAGQNKLEDLMKCAMSGQKLSNQEMIGIQAGVYMYSQQMELTSKVIEKATSGIKQTMNTQV